uniref:Uncharacterized protein n=1 Tax=Strigamia maritima TaxID=126957 RepID=T1JA85_STRMM
MGKEPSVSANPIKKFILKLGLKVDEFGKTLEVKILPGEEKVVVLSPVERFRNSHAAGDVQLNDESISPAVKKKFVEPAG